MAKQRRVWTRLVLCCSLSLFWREAQALSNKIPIYYDSSNHLHRDLQYHPEQPARIEACVQALKAEFGQGIHLMDVAEKHPISPEELEYARAMLVEAHSEEYVSRLETRCLASKQRRMNEGKNPLGFVGYVDDDTYLTTESYDVCLRAVACWIRAVNAATTTATATSMALTRPPGHHATKKLANGFCLFNFCATAALHAVKANPHARVSILDWDVHYGQGVADIVKGHSNIRYASIHQTPAFPYMGEQREVQHGNILTIPIPADTTWTCGYQNVLEHVALPFLVEQGPPDIVIVSAGYDALDSEELASVSLTASDFGKATRLLMEHFGNNKALVLGLEGGYQLKDQASGNLPHAVVETIKALFKAAQQ